MIDYKEKRRLISGWDKGDDDKLSDSLRYHFNEHGAKVGALDLWQYLRKAEAFAQNLKGAQKARLDSGKTRYTKNGRYIIQTANGKTLSFGISR